MHGRRFGWPIGAALLMASTLEARQADDLAAVVASAREALGGEAALTHVTSFAVAASLGEVLNGHDLSFSVEYKCVLPDRFLITRRQDVPFGGSLTYYSGFNGDELIKNAVLNTPAPLPDLGPTTPEGIAEARAKQLAGIRHTFVFLTVPMFMSSFSSVPVQFKLAGRQPIDGRDADLVDVTTADGQTRRLYLSTATHLPVRITWRAKPIVAGATVAVRTTTVTNSRGELVTPPTSSTSSTTGTVPPGDPAAGLSEVDWQTDISDYKKADGVNWPHHLVTSYGGHRYDDWRFGKFAINGRIDDATFTVKK